MLAKIISQALAEGHTIHQISTSTWRHDTGGDKVKLDGDVLIIVSNGGRNTTLIPLSSVVSIHVRNNG